MWSERRKVVTRLSGVLVKLTPRAIAALFVLAAAVLVGGAQTQGPASPLKAAQAATPPLPADPAALLELASQANGLHGSDLKPWHLRATWQRLDEKKQVTSEGTWEEWWAADMKYKIAVSSKGDQQTLWGTDRGVFVVSAAKNDPTTNEIPAGEDVLPSADFAALPHSVPEAAFLLERLLTHPVPELTPAGLAHMRLLESRSGEVGNGLVCALQAFVLPGGEPHVSPDKDGHFQPSINRYCFDDHAPVLRIESGPGQVITFNSLVRFQNRYLARAIHISQTTLQVYTTEDPTLSQTSRRYSPVQEADIRVDVAEALATMSEADFTPPGTALHLPEIRTRAVTEGIMPGERVSGGLSSYPAEAREWHIQGTVVVNMTILKDGTVGDIRVISGPRALQPALDAIKAWRFEPYLVGGRPVEVSTQIRMNFNYN